MCLYIELFLQNHIINTYCLFIVICQHKYVAKYRNVFSCFWYCKIQKNSRNAKKRAKNRCVCYLFCIFCIFCIFLHLFAGISAICFLLSFLHFCYLFLNCTIPKTRKHISIYLQQS